MKNKFDFTDSMTEQEYQDFINYIQYCQHGAGY